jgi:hypothetical protein
MRLHEKSPALLMNGKKMMGPETVADDFSGFFLITVDNLNLH